MRAVTGDLVGACSTSNAQYHTELFKLSLDLICIRRWFDFEVSIKIAICFGLHAVRQSPPINGEFQARFNSTDPQHNPSCYEQTKDGTNVQAKICFSGGSKVYLVSARLVCAWGSGAKRRLRKMTPFGGRGGLVPASDPDLTAVKR